MYATNMSNAYVNVNDIYRAPICKNHKFNLGLIYCRLWKISYTFIQLSLSLLLYIDTRMEDVNADSIFPRFLYLAWFLVGIGFEASSSPKAAAVIKTYILIIVSILQSLTNKHKSFVILLRPRSATGEQIMGIMVCFFTNQR